MMGWNPTPPTFLTPHGFKVLLSDLYNYVILLLLSCSCVCVTFYTVEKGKESSKKTKTEVGVFCLFESKAGTKRF